MVDEGYLEIKTDYAEQSSGYDDRSVAKKMVDAYKSLFSNQITNSTLEQLSYSIAVALFLKCQLQKFVKSITVGKDSINKKLMNGELKMGLVLERKY